MDRASDVTPGALGNTELIRQLVMWVLARPRTYEETMSAWRTSCPRLPIWEEAVDLGLVRVEKGEGAVWTVAVTRAGESFLDAVG